MGREAIPAGVEPALPDRQSGVVTAGPRNREGQTKLTVSYLGALPTELQGRVVTLGGLEPPTSST